MLDNKNNEQVFNKLRDSLLNIDPVHFCQKYLTLDGKPFRLEGNGYKPFCDIYRYIGIKALEPDALPVILVKSRQTAGTTMANALEMFFMGSGLFGANNKPPIRVIHAFPLLEHAAAYSKTKLNTMINSSVTIGENKPGVKSKSYMQSLLDQTSATNDSLHFKQFVGGNHIWIESTGLTGDRLRGRTADAIFFDECFTYDQKVKTNIGNIQIGELYKMFSEGKELPTVYSFNEKTEQFEYKTIRKAWKKEEKEIYELACASNKIRCTGNHRFLTSTGWKPVQDMQPGDLIKTAYLENNYQKYLLSKVENIINTQKKEVVYDIEVEDNHNFIVTSDENIIGLIAHNCQDHTSAAIGNSIKMLTTAKYGRPGKGIQVYFGTPKRKGSDFHKMWQRSSQQYYHLGCENCNKFFPLYTPESDEWERIWLHGFIVKCTHCGHEQDKRPAAERGRWIPMKNSEEEECQLMGFHINQVYMPAFTKEDILNEKPGAHPINTERVYQNEVLGEFFQGDASPITVDEIRDKCGDVGRKFSAKIVPNPNEIIVAGVDYGARNDMEQLANPNAAKSVGQSYSTAVVLKVTGPNLLNIEFATKFKKNDLESKKSFIDQMLRQYSIQLAIGDIGYSNDFSELMHTAHGDKYLVSRAQGKINHHVKFNKDVFPKEILFERDFYISELYELMKKGNVRFPLGDYEKVGWLMDHCASMEIKPSISRVGEPTIHYVKGGTPNDGFMALLNAYIAYKFILTKGFSVNNPILQQQNFGDKKKPLVVLGHIPRML